MVSFGFSKTLTPSDANNGGDLRPTLLRGLYSAQTRSDRRSAGAEPHHPRPEPQAVDFQAHIPRNAAQAPPYHGWSKYVNSKMLMSGDSVVFIKKKSTGDLFARVRRSGASSVLPRPVPAAGLKIEETVVEEKEKGVKRREREYDDVGRLLICRVSDLIFKFVSDSVI